MFKYTIEDFKLATLYLQRKGVSYDEYEDIIDRIALANLTYKINEEYDGSKTTGFGNNYA